MASKGPADALEAKWAESAMEKESRSAANFQEIENQLPKRYPVTNMSLIDEATSSLFGSKNPFRERAHPEHNYVWLLDNTAFQTENPKTGKLEPWQAEMVACFFIQGRQDITASVSKIADLIGLDGQAGGDPEARSRIEERLRPFVWAIAPARTVEVSIANNDTGNSGAPHNLVLGPSNRNGISSQLLPVGGDTDSDGTTVNITSDLFPDIDSDLHFAGPEGFAVISDVDDTIKITGTSDPLRVLRSTFAEIPKPTEGMPDFYNSLDQLFNKPAWFYLSASPYNLYPFLHQFIQEHYKPGTTILRDSSWMYFAGLLQSFTEGVQEYKVDRGVKIHSWLPKRKFICIGDSTQADPESYAELYHKFPGWIKAIYIRKVVDLPHMEQKNKPERFAKAFKGVHEQVWRVFVNPSELGDHVKDLAAGLHE